MVDFLDVNLDLKTGLHKPFVKPNQTPLYVHNLSNHPKHILENIPKAVNERLSKLSSNQAVFDEAAPVFQEALSKSGYNHQLSFNPPIPPTTKKNKSRKREVTWFNPPWNDSVKTNVGKKFLRILDTSFSHDNPLKKLVKRSTIKISYKCMPNMGTLVSSHNSKLLRQNNTPPDQGCNCQGGPNTCPLAVPECKKRSVVYVASVESTDGVEHYTGLTGGAFKNRWYQHMSDINNNKTSTTLSSHIRKLKEEGKTYNLRWDIMDRAPVYNPVSKKCRLCLKEAYYIIFKPESASLNHRNELFNTCRHRRQKLLCRS